VRTWLKETRERKKLTQLEVAEKSKISRSFYTHIEKGTKTPSVSVAKQISKTLDIPWTNFFNDESSLKEQSA
jgi:putative transcriptional regulator